MPIAKQRERNTKKKMKITHRYSINVNIFVNGLFGFKYTKYTCT